MLQNFSRIYFEVMHLKVYDIILVFFSIFCYYLFHFRSEYMCYALTVSKTASENDLNFDRVSYTPMNQQRPFMQPMQSVLQSMSTLQQQQQDGAANKRVANDLPLPPYPDNAEYTPQDNAYINDGVKMISNYLLHGLFYLYGQPLPYG